MTLASYNIDVVIKSGYGDLTENTKAQKQLFLSTQKVHSMLTTPKFLVIGMSHTEEGDLYGMINIYEKFTLKLLGRFKGTKDHQKVGVNLVAGENSIGVEEIWFTETETNWTGFNVLQAFETK